MDGSAITRSPYKSLWKYFSVFSLSLQQAFYYRASFLMDRARSITILIAFYAFWTAIYRDRTDLAGYSKAEMMTYILGMNILRALIFTDKTWDVIREINTGKISSYLTRPISYIGYCVSRDLADKLIYLFSALAEVMIAVWLMKIPLVFPEARTFYLQVVPSVFLAMILFFLMSYAVSAFAFWTAESAGPRFCFELLLEFGSGAFFPLNVLPDFIRKSFEVLPFASLLFFPLNVYLGKVSATEWMQGVTIQIVWIAIFAVAVRNLWQRGVRVYSAQGG